MRFVALAPIVLALAGCGTDLGGPCSQTDPCGDGAVCDLTHPDGPVCVSADGDDDGDGIPNHLDFCQHQEGGRFDEDLDGIGDDCDRCPIAPPPATPDPDGDEVDSPCDPDPTVAGDRIVVFDGFNGPTLPSTWTTTTPGAWEIRGGQLIVTAPTVGLETLTAPLPLTSNHMAVLSSYRVDAVDPAASENAASVIAVDRRPAGLSIVSCGGSRTGGTDRLLLDTDLANQAQSFTSLFDTAGLYRLAARVENAQAACAMIANAETGAVQAGTSGQSMTEAGLSARGATVRFSYLLVIQRARIGAPQ